MATTYRTPFGLDLDARWVAADTNPARIEVRVDGGDPATAVEIATETRYLALLELPYGAWRLAYQQDDGTIAHVLSADRGSTWSPS
jgi:hypothetical protein